MKASNFITTTPGGDQVRNPRAIVMVNNIRLLITEIVLVTSPFFVSDNFQIEAPLSGQNSNLSLDYWASSTQFSIQIYIGFPSDPNNYSTQDLQLFMSGDADEVELDIPSQRIFIYGRDYSSKFIDNLYTSKYSNQTASQIVTQLAQSQGLTPIVTKTTTNIGNLTQNAQIYLTSQSSQWDVITYLAQQENFVGYVQNNNFIFAPRPDTGKTSSSNIYPLTYQLPMSSGETSTFPGMSFSITRRCNLCSQVWVKIKCGYNPRTGQAFSVIVKSERQPRTYLNDVPQSTNRIQKYIYSYPGLSQQQAQQKAQQLLHDLSIHEICLNMTLPGDNLLIKDSVIKITGTNTTFDQNYYPDQIIRRINNEEGYIMEVSAKNISQDMEVQQ